MLMSKFKMAAIFEFFFISLPLHRCIDRSNQLRIKRRAFFDDFYNSNGMRPLPLHNRNGRCHGSWVNFYTTVKSQLKMRGQSLV